MKSVFTSFIGVLLLVFAAVLNPYNHFISGFVLIIGSMVLYFLSQFFVYSKNWLDIRPVFSTVWIFTSGLASFRMMQYQRAWEVKTWILFIAVYFFFMVGCDVGLIFGGSISRWCSLRRGKRMLNISLELHENRLFWVCFGVTIMGMLCFVGTAHTVGFIPYFSSSPTASPRSRMPIRSSCWMAAPLPSAAHTTSCWPRRACTTTCIRTSTVTLRTLPQERTCRR